MTYDVRHCHSVDEAVAGDRGRRAPRRGGTDLVVGAAGKGAAPEQPRRDPPLAELRGIEARRCEVFPTAPEFGFPDELSAFGLQFAHGLGLNLHERPIISRVVSMDHPTEIKEGMVFAIETWAPATDGYSAARIEEEVVVTDKGCKLISLFPAEELPISAKY